MSSMKVQSLTTSLFLAVTTLAQNTKVCPANGGGVCYQVNIPARTANGGDGDIFFQISGPSSMQWVALGTGRRMIGANMFVLYTSANNDNVTLSPRLATAYAEPRFNQQAQVTLLDGSGISDGMMTANVRCSNCQSWSGGTLNVKSSSSDWVWAARTGASINSDSQSADIERHSMRGSLTFDLTRASGGDTLNPFIETQPTQSSANMASSPTGAASSPTASADESISGSESNDESFQILARVIEAHGVVLGLAFVVLFPLGALLMRVLSFRGLVWVHAGTQVLTYSLAIAGLGMGVWIANETSQLNEAHPILGIVIIALLLAQPALGLIHHFQFVKRRTPTNWGRTHVWYGRGLIILGVINGGLGLQLADNTEGGKIAYGVVAGVMFCVYLVIVALFMSRKRRAAQESNDVKREAGSG
ncbi:MAG: hypothetical protein M1816_007030 [Peltula sp. TS41687]|nr:MAG: hypothetical protein M1816_007030 [Peltula sp. TS41687]